MVKQPKPHFRYRHTDTYRHKEDKIMSIGVDSKPFVVVDTALLSGAELTACLGALGRKQDMQEEAA